MAVAIVLGALAGAAGVAPLFAGLRMTRRVTDTSNLGHAGALLLGVLLSVAVLFVTASRASSSCPSFLPRSWLFPSRLSGSASAI